jgi:hypothetical protein
MENNNTPATEPVNALVVLINKAGLEPETAKTLQERFQQFYITAKEWEAKAKEIVITDASQTDLMSLARSGRLLLKNIRNDVEKTRKTLKEDSLRKGQAIDGIAKTLKGLIEPIEEYLEKQENYVQLQEAKRQTELRATRSQELSQYGVVMPPSYDLGKTPDDMYATMLAGAKKKHEDAIEAERLEKEEKLRQEQEAAAEKERLRLDNERLRQEAETARVEQERKDAEATAEREKLQAELAEKEEELSRQALTLQVEREEVDRLGQEMEQRAARKPGTITFYKADGSIIGTFPLKEFSETADRAAVATANNITEWSHYTMHQHEDGMTPAGDAWYKVDLSTGLLIEESRCPIDTPNVVTAEELMHTFVPAKTHDKALSYPISEPVLYHKEGYPIKKFLAFNMPDGPKCEVEFTIHSNGTCSCRVTQPGFDMKRIELFVGAPLDALHLIRDSINEMFAAMPTANTANNE